MTTTNLESQHHNLESLNHCLSLIGEGTNVEWDETEQYLLIIPKKLFRFKAQIFDLVGTHGFNVGSHINGHGFIRPREVGATMDLMLSNWVFEVF